MTYFRPPVDLRLATHPAHALTPVLGPRRSVAALWSRHPDQVRRHCRPIACDVMTRTPLYDADEAGLILASLRRRVA